MMIKGAVSTISDSLLQDPSHQRYAKRKVCAGIVEPTLLLRILQCRNADSLPPPPPLFALTVRPGCSCGTQEAVDSVKLEVDVYLGIREAPKEEIPKRPIAAAPPATLTWRAARCRRRAASAPTRLPWRRRRVRA